MEGLGEARGVSPETPRFSVGDTITFCQPGLGEADVEHRRFRINNEPPALP